MVHMSAGRREEMDIRRAAEIVKTLAGGVDPTTGEIISEESVYNKPDVIRALYILLDAVQEKTDPLRNAGKPWNEIEDEKLKDEFASKMPTSAIAIEHGRTEGAIESRLVQLKLKKKPFWLFKRNR